MSCFSAITRTAPPEKVQQLVSQDVHPLMARLFAARGIGDKTEIGGSLGDLIPPDELTNSRLAGELLADAIVKGQRLLVIGDYDCDGATATALAVGVLTELGACVDYLIPHRVEHGYGLSVDIAQLAMEKKPDWVITVDSGISDVIGVEMLRAAGIGVIITDHHLAPAELPNAHTIVNPNMPNATFASPYLAGVGVIFYVMLQLRAVLRERGFFSNGVEPNLAHYLDLVTLGTVADMVRLDRNNRILVAEGLKRIRAGQAHHGLLGLLRVSGRKFDRVSTEDLGFFVAPRLNAAGRLGDMQIGVDCLLADNILEGTRLADKLDKLNRERQSIQESMVDSAERLLRQQLTGTETITLFHEAWHEGIIGIVAGRLKERFQKPVFVFAPANDELLKGSGRSVAGIHLHGILVEIDSRYPSLLKRFGGHAAAAGVAIPLDGLETFKTAFETIVLELLSGGEIKPVLETDGSLDVSFCTVKTAQLIEEQVWGQGFPPPLFVDHFEIEKVESINGRHMRLHVSREGRHFEAVQFHAKQVPSHATQMAYRLVTNRYRGQESLKLQIEGWVE